MRRINRWWVLPLVMVLSLLPAGRMRAAVPDVLNQLPQDALVVISVPNLAQLSAKLAMVDKTLRLGRPELQDALSFVKGMTNMHKGLDDNGGLAVALKNLPVDGSDPDVAMVVPVSDYKAFLSNFDVQDTGQPVEAEIQGEVVTIRQAGKYAVMSNNAETVKNYQATSIAAKLGAMGGEASGRSDLMVYVDVEKLGPVLQPLLAVGMAQMQAQMLNQGLPEQQLQMMQSMFKVYGAVANALLTDGQSLVMGLDMSENGLGITYGAQFKQDSGLGQAFAKAPSEPLKLNRVPNRPFLFAMAMDFSNLPMKRWAENLKLLLGDDAWSKAMLSSLDLASLDGGQVQGAYYAPGAGAGGSLFNGVFVYMQQDPAAFMNKYRESFAALNGLQLAEGFNYQTTWKANVMQIDGRPVDQYQMKINYPPDLIAGNPMAMFMQDFSGYVTATDKAVIMTAGADPLMLKEAIAVSDGSGKMGADPGIAAVAPQLGSNRIMEGYLGVGTVLQMVSQLMSLFAPDAAFKAPKDLPPIAMGMSAAGGGASFRLYVPMKIVTSGMELAQKFTGGLGGVAPAPAAPAPAEQNLGEHVVILDADNFDAAVLKSDKPVLVDFWATWCPPCRKQNPIVAELAADMKDKAVVAKLDVDEQPALANKYEIKVIPTLLVFKGGKVVQKFEGLQAKEKLAAALEAAK